jgi:hypothetical protein
MKVYIEDPAGGDTLIDGVNCRKLGTLKNGETKAFPIDSHAARVYVIADKISKNYCNDYYVVPEGDFDVFLSGKNLYNPASGNAFRFDGTANEEVVQNRKKGSKKGMIILIVSIVIGVIIGRVVGAMIADSLFGERPETSSTDGIEIAARPETFTADGIEITLTSDFIEVDQDGFVACYGTEDVSVLIVEDLFSDFPELKDMTVAEYTDMFIEYNELTAAEERSHDGLTCVEYEAAGDKAEYLFSAYIFKTGDSFCMVQFAVETDNADEYREDIAEWAKTIKVQ